MPGPLGTPANSPVILDGTHGQQASPKPGVLGVPGTTPGASQGDAVGSSAKEAKTTATPTIAPTATSTAPSAEPPPDPETLKLAAIAYGEASTADNEDEIKGIAFAVAMRARAWGGKTVDELLKADPNYTFVVKDGSPRYNRLMKATAAEIEKDKGMKWALLMAKTALEEAKKPTPVGSNLPEGTYWWDGVDFKTNPGHAKVKQGFHFSDAQHNIFGLTEKTNVTLRGNSNVMAIEKETGDTVIYWENADKNGVLVRGKERGRFRHTWISRAAFGSTIFWAKDPDYLKATKETAYGR